MQFKQGEMEMTIMNLQNQIEENKLSHGLYVRKLNEKHENQNTKKILKISELEDKILDLEDQLNLKDNSFSEISKKNLILKDEISNLNKGISRKNNESSRISPLYKQLQIENEKLLKKDEEKRKNLAGITKNLEKAKYEIEKLKLEVRKLNKAVDRKSENIIQIWDKFILKMMYFKN